MNLADYVDKDCSNLMIATESYFGCAVTKVVPMVFGDSQYRVSFIDRNGLLDAYSNVKFDGAGIGSAIVMERKPTNNTDNMFDHYTYGVRIESDHVKYGRVAIGHRATLDEARQLAQETAQKNQGKKVFIFAPIAVFQTELAPVNETALTL